jgi:hypothetical protein
MLWLTRVGFCGAARNRESQPHPRAASARPDRRGIVEFDPAAVIFQNTADNGEAKAGALLAGRNIGL